MINREFRNNIEERIKDIEESILYSCLPENLNSLRETRNLLKEILETYIKVHTRDEDEMIFEYLEEKE